jgi:DNA-directed RNA polymerase subunit M/transcription elongation factor TFIIS
MGLKRRPSCESTRHSVANTRDRIRRMVDQSKPSPTVMPISCPHCQQKQVIHVVAREGIAQLGKQTINCLKCKGEIEVTIPDQIAGGPFEAT